jgi:hypothetical protein
MTSSDRNTRKGISLFLNIRIFQNKFKHQCGRNSAAFGPANYYVVRRVLGFSHRKSVQFVERNSSIK